MISDKDKGGRPTKYKVEYAAQAEKFCRLGATDSEVADFFGVDVRTIYRWKAENDNFCQSLKTGKEMADERVERSLYARAIGYQHEDTDIRVIEGQIVQTPIAKHYPPDTVAGIFWLKNRRSQEWRDKVLQEHTGPDGKAIEHDMTLKVTFVKPDGNSTS